jgi:hypothetical protein
VLSAWGEKGDWYRNLEATPALEIRTGGERYVPEQRFLAQRRIMLCSPTPGGATR